MHRNKDMIIFRRLPFSDHVAAILKDLDVTDQDLALSQSNYVPHPLRINEKCRWCHHFFDSVPIFIPTSRTEKGFVVTSCHCSPECARAKQQSDPALAGIDTKLLEEYCSALGLPSFPLTGAPGLDGLLEGYDGPLTIEQYRERFTTRLVWRKPEELFEDEDLDLMEVDGKLVVLFPTASSAGDPFRDGGRTFAQIKGRPTLQALTLSPHIVHVGETLMLQTLT